MTQEQFKIVKKITLNQERLNSLMFEGLIRKDFFNELYANDDEFRRGFDKLIKDTEYRYQKELEEL